MFDYLFSSADQFQEGKKSTKRPRELDNEAVRQELSGVIEHVRIGHLLPAHGELLDNVMRRGLVERCVPLDIGEGSYFPHSPWMRNQGEKGFVRPRLFMPYYEESKVGLVSLCFNLFMKFSYFLLVFRSL